MDTELTDDTDGIFEDTKNCLFDVTSEASLIHAILSDNAQYETIGLVLRPSHFFDARYCRIFEALV